ncbi:MAG: hypothetical protein Ta2A_25710 [Treponemataceae bacterium]|nr:MAG: hypothetical protein Ta2A_25710 [Treponemataceae bacterium]
MKLYFAYRVLSLCVMHVLTSVALFAQTTWTTNGVYSAPHSATATLGMVTPGYFPLSLRYTFEAPRIFASLGFQVKNEVEDYNHEDIALNAIYFLRLPERFRIGFGGTYHVNWMNETDEDKHITHLISTTQDIQLGVYATVSFWRMYANVNALWFGTMQTLESLPGRILFQSDSAVSVYLGGHVADNFTAEIGVSSYQFYKYDLHIAPYFSFALRYEFLTEYFAEKPLAGHLFAEFSQTAHYTDFFTLSGLLKNASSTFTVGYNWGRAKK